MRRARGFTLIEILISLSLASLLIAGAFQIHAVFTAQSMRQKELDDLQQSLRIAMQTIERAVRGAGAGMSNGKAVITPGCLGIRNLYRAQFYNSNAWPPVGVNNGTNVGFDTTMGTNDDVDSDILRVITAADAGTMMAPQPTPIVSLASPTALTGYLPNDFLLFINTSVAAPGGNGCFMQLTGPMPASIGAAPLFNTPNVPLAVGGSLSCANSNEVNCFSTISWPTPVRHFSTQTYFYVQPPNPAIPQDTPKFSVAILPISTDPTLATPLSMLTDDIEDMQIALMMNDGRVCFQLDDPTQCDPSQASALRVTLTARTNVPRLVHNGGATAAWSQPGGYEDMPLNPANIPFDGRLRRSMTSEITLRN